MNSSDRLMEIIETHHTYKSLMRIRTPYKTHILLTAVLVTLTAKK